MILQPFPLDVSAIEERKDLVWLRWWCLNYYWHNDVWVWLQKKGSIKCFQQTCALHIKMSTWRVIKNIFRSLKTWIGLVGWITSHWTNWQLVRAVYDSNIFIRLKSKYNCPALSFSKKIVAKELMKIILDYYILVLR